MSQNQDSPVDELTSEQVLDTALEIFSTRLDVEVDGGDYTMRDVWSVLLEAASQGSVEAACRALEEAPCGNTVRSYLQAYLLGEIDALEEMCNEALVSRLPDRIQGQDHDIGIDLHYIPYHGEPDEKESELRRSEAKDTALYDVQYRVALPTSTATPRSTSSNATGLNISRDILDKGKVASCDWM